MIIMQIFGFVVHARLRLSRRLIKLALKTYSNSEVLRSKVHKEMNDRAGLLKRDAAPHPLPRPLVNGQI